MSGTGDAAAAMARSAVAAIGLDVATRIVDAAFAAAARRSLPRLAVVVTDPGGHVRAAMRTDGHGAFGIDIAHAKAKSALGFGRSTSQLAVHFGANPSSTIGVGGATRGRFLPLGGGVVAVDAHGLIVGAVAVAGGLPDVDDAVAREALVAVGLEALP